MGPKAVDAAFNGAVATPFHSSLLSFWFLSDLGGAANTVHLVTADGVESWERMEKGLVAMKLAGKIADALG